MVDFLLAASQNLSDRSSPIPIPGLVDGCKDLLTSFSFFPISQGMLPCQPIKVESRKPGIFPVPVSVMLPSRNGL